MIGLKQYTSVLLGALVGGAVLVHAAATYAQVDKCQAAIEAAADAYRGSVYKALKACVDGVQKNRVAGKPYAGAAAGCEKALAAIYNVDGSIPAGKTAAEKLQTAINLAVNTKQFCTANALIQMSHQVSGAGLLASAPGTNIQDFLVSYELMAQETAAVQHLVAANTSFFGLMNLAVTATESAVGKQDATQCGVCSLESGECAGGTHWPCTQNSDCTAYDPKTKTGNAGAARPNLCSWNPQCLYRTCTAGGDTGATLVVGSLGGAPVSFPLEGQLSLGICQVAPAATVGYGQGAGAHMASLGLVNTNELYVVGSNTGTLAAIPLLPNATVCVNTIGAEGYCDCGAHGKKDISYCQDRIATGKNPDACGNVPIPPTGFPGNPDPDFPGTIVGYAVPSYSTASVDGDCLVLDTTQFKILDPTQGELGNDGVPCTADDLKAPSAAITVPLTTGSATATMNNAVFGTTFGSCPGDSNVECIDIGGCTGCNIKCGYGGAGLCPDGVTACTVDKDCTKKAYGICRADGTTACAADKTCIGITGCDTSSMTFSPMSVGPVAGASIGCDDIAGGSLTGLKLVGAFPSGGSSKSVLGDSITAFTLECGS